MTCTQWSVAYLQKPQDSPKDGEICELKAPLWDFETRKVYKCYHSLLLAEKRQEAVLVGCSSKVDDSSWQYQSHPFLQILK